MDTPITFVRTRHTYESYTDFFALVTLSGFPLIYVDEVDVSRPGVFIVTPMSGEWRPHIDNQLDKSRRAHLILWNLERPSGNGAVGRYMESCHDLMEKRHVDEVWVSDRRLADETATRFVVLGSHPDLGQVGTDKKYQFCHMSYEVPRRQNIYKHFLNDHIGPNGWGEERHQTLLQSKFALNVHQDGWPFQEPLRFALFAAYGLPIVTETIYDSYPWSEETMIYASYESLVRVLRAVLTSQYEPYREMGKRARTLMCETLNFRKMVEEAIAQSVGGDWRVD